MSCGESAASASVDANQMDCVFRGNYFTYHYHFYQKVKCRTLPVCLSGAIVCPFSFSLSPLVLVIVRQGVSRVKVNQLPPLLPPPPLPSLLYYSLISDQWWWWWWYVCVW